MGRRGNRGQVMLLAVLLTAVVVVVAGSVFFESITQTKVSKLEEESLRALKAAEGLAEEALNQQTTVLLDSQQINLPGAEGKAEIKEVTSNTFTTPALTRNEQFTFYFYDYKTGNPGSAVSPLMKIEPDKVDICNSNPFVLEITFVNLSNYSFDRKFVGCSGVDLTEVSFGSSFSAPSSHLMIMRVLAENTSFPEVKLTVTRLDAGSWPPQGIEVVSTVRTASGVKKTVRLFQYYPQLPSTFFVTRFDN